MSKPGDPGREQILASSPEETVAKTADLVARNGAVTFEHGYGPPPGTEWPDDYEPTAEDDVLWYAEAVIRRKVAGHRPIDTRYRGEALVTAGASHYKGSVYACVDLLELLGVNVLVLNTADNHPEEPTTG